MPLAGKKIGYLGQIEVIEPRQRAGLVVELLARLRFRSGRQVDRFDRTASSGQANVVGQIDRAHAAPPDQIDDPVPFAQYCISF